MILAIVPSPMYVPIGTLLSGRSDNSGLPDYALYTQFAKTNERIGECIGDDIIYTGHVLYKVFANWNNVLYEYTLASTKIPTLEDTSEFIVPISLKSYVNGCKTYLYIKGIETWKNINVKFNGEPYITISLTCLLDQMIKRCKPEDFYLLGEIKNFMVNVWDEYLSVEAPNEVLNMMFELGSQCLDYSGSAIQFLYANYGDDIRELGPIFSYGIPNDYISAYGCSDAQAFKLSTLPHYVESGSNSFYNSIAEDHRKAILSSMHEDRMLYLDNKNPLFNDLDMLSFIDATYCESCTDFTVVLTEKGVESAKGSVLFGPNVELTSVSMCNGAITSYIRMYNSRNLGRYITAIMLDKNWLDELFVIIQYSDGSGESWFVNLAWYHLYSPSVLRVQTVNQISST